MASQRCSTNILAVTSRRYNIKVNSIPPTTPSATCPLTSVAPANNHTIHDSLTSKRLRKNYHDCNIEHSGPHQLPRLKHPPLPTDPARWRVGYKHIKRAITSSNDSAPGPDGIPFLAWRVLSPLSNEILFSVAEALSTPEYQTLLAEAYHDISDEHPHHYNYSTMTCLPKKSQTTADNNLPAFYPANTRPLRIVNTDTRIVASSARLAWVLILDT